MTDHHEHHADERVEPNRVRLLVHATALVVVGAAHASIGEVIARIMNRLNVHLDETPWVQRGTAYNQRAFRIIRPWCEAADQLARWHAEHEVQPCAAHASTSTMPDTPQPIPPEPCPSRHAGEGGSQR